MAEESVITEESFEKLLVWLDLNRDTAAEKYEKLRQRLIRIFMGRGCREAEQLADETFNRVTRKLPEIVDGYRGDPALYFFGVADKIHLEWLRKQKNINQLRLHEKIEQQDTVELEIQYDCLENCLKKLPPDQHQLIVEYYKKEKSAKIKNRRELAKIFNISVNALQVKTSRIRTQLKGCLRDCLAGKK